MEKIQSDGMLWQIIRGVITTVAITLVCVLVFAFVLSVTNLDDGVVKPVNQFIKLLSIFGGAMFSIKGEKGFVKGLITGLVSTIASFLIFGLIGGGLNLGLGLLIDFVCGGVMGGLSGAIAVNVKK